MGKNKEYEIGTLLRERRVQLNLTMKEVADECGVSESTVSRWETGKIASIKRGQIYSLSQILHISLATITGSGDINEEVPATLVIKRENLQKLAERCSEEQLDNIIKFVKTFILK